MRILVGYFIRRAIRNADAVRGKTFSAYGHRLHPTAERAQRALDDLREYDMLDPRFEYDVAEAWFDSEANDGA